MRVPPGKNVEAQIRKIDAIRLDYVRLHYGEDRFNPLLYDIMIDSKNQPEKVARLIVSAMNIVP